MSKPVILLCLLCTLGLVFCAQPEMYDNPDGYDFAHPKKFILKRSLHEISGIIMLNNDTKEIGAIQDEEGKFFYFRPGDTEYKHAKFSSRGDYEDVALMHNKDVIVLRSDGSLFLFPLPDIGNAEISSTRECKNILPAGEYEGLFADGDTLFALCKNCPADNQKKEISVFRLGLDNQANLQVANQFKINLSPLHVKTAENKKPKIHPSGLAKHPITHEWYIISSVNKMLIILDQQWKIKKHYMIDPAMFKQPEGIAFDNSGNLFISNEGGDGDANILQFNYTPKR